MRIEELRIEGAAKISDAPVPCIKIMEFDRRSTNAVAQGKKYVLPKVRKDYAGIVISLSRHERPNTEGFADSEIVWRMRKDYHIGLIVQSKTQGRVIDLLNDYTQRIFSDFHAAAPVPDKPTS